MSKTFGGLGHGGETHHVSYGGQLFGECSSCYGGGHAPCSGCDGSLHDVCGHSYQCGGGHGGHAHGSCYFDECDDGGGLSNGVCGSHA